MPEFLRPAAPAAAFLLCLTAAPLAVGACQTPPRPPVMPQGATATDEEMRTGRETLQKYVNALQAYQTCMNQQVKDAPPDTKPEVKAQWQANADAAIEAAQEIADVYSIQLRAFKSRQ